MSAELFELKVLVLRSEVQEWPHDTGKTALRLVLQTIPALHPYPASQKWELWLPAEAEFQRIFTTGSILVLGLSDLKSATGLKLRSATRKSDQIWSDIIALRVRLSEATTKQAAVDKELGKLCSWMPVETYKARQAAMSGPAKERFAELSEERRRFAKSIDEMLASQAKLEAEHAESLKPRIEEPAAA